jgi:hypothetical protein
MEESLENLNKLAAKNGLVVGLIGFAITILTYYVMPAQLGSPMYGIGVMVVSLILYIIFTLDLRKKIGGYWSFKDALRGIFLMAFVAGVVGLVANYLFYNVIEPDAYDKISGYVSQGLSETYENLGMSQEQIDETVEKMQESLKSQYSPTLGDLFKSLGLAILMEFVLSLIFAAIFKKDRPVFAEVSEA